MIVQVLHNILQLALLELWIPKKQFLCSLMFQKRISAAQKRISATYVTELIYTTEYNQHITDV